MDFFFKKIKSIPVLGVYPYNRVWSTVALEAGYSKSYESLVEDATILLEGSKGRVGLVIIIKIFPLKPRETTLQKGFVEVWYLDPLTSKAAKRQNRMV